MRIPSFARVCRRALVPGVSFLAVAACGTVPNSETPEQLADEYVDFSLRIPAAERSPLVVAHDWHAAASRERLTLEDALEAFTRPPLDQVRINLDFKLPGREDEAVEILRRHGLGHRLSMSTMEVSTVAYFRDHAPEISRGWTVPKVTRDWLSKPAWMKPALGMGLLAVRRRMPSVVRNGIIELEPEAIWAFYGVLSPRLIKVVKDAGLKLNVWTVDDPERIASLAAMGVDGICSNDPRLLNR